EKREIDLSSPFDEQTDDYVKEIKETQYFFETYKDEQGNVFPMDYHYAFYLEVKENIKNNKPTKEEKEFVQIAEKRMGYLKNNPQFKKEFESGEEIFRRQQNEKILLQLENATNAVKMKDDSVVIV